MRTIRLLYIAVLLYSLISACSTKNEEIKDIIDPECYLEHIPDAYDYPVKPGTPEWAELESSAEMDSVCKIPVEILNSISTAGLVETVMNYPRFGDMYFGNTGSIQASFEIIAGHYNGFQELFERNDAAIHLLERYILMYPKCLNNNYSLETVPVQWRFSFIEILLAQYEILNQLEQSYLEALLYESIQKYEEKKQFGYSIMMSQSFSMYIAGRIMFISDYTPFVEEYEINAAVKDFIDEIHIFVQEATLETIYEYSSDY